VMAAQPSWNKVLSGLHHLAVLCSAGSGGPVGLELTRITAPTGDSDTVGSGVPGGIVEAKATMPWRFSPVSPASPWRGVLPTWSPVQEVSASDSSSSTGGEFDWLLFLWMKSLREKLTLVTSVDRLW
jgi:hypothetical protein